MNILELYEPPINKHDVLNPKLWEGRGVLKSEVQGALLRIAKDFIEFCKVDIPVEDIVITGGNANYTYTSHSDIDLHIVADLSNVACDREIHELFNSKRLLYKQQYDITIHKIPVELYVEDVMTPAVSGGCYSVLNKKWNKEPTNIDNIEYNETEVKELAEKWKTVINHFVKIKDADSSRRMLNLLREFRRKGLATKMGEFSIPNLLYKSLRNDKTIVNLQNLLDADHEKHLSIIQ